MVDILSLMLYTKFGCHTPPPPPPPPPSTRTSLFFNVYGLNGKGKVGRTNGRYI